MSENSSRRIQNTDVYPKGLTDLLRLPNAVQSLLTKGSVTEIAEELVVLEDVGKRNRYEETIGQKDMY